MGCHRCSRRRRRAARGSKMSQGLHNEPLSTPVPMENQPQASPACTCWRSSARFCYCARKRASPCRRSAGRRLRFPRAAAATAARGFVGMYLIHKDGRIL